MEVLQAKVRVVLEDWCSVDTGWVREAGGATGLRCLPLTGPVVVVERKGTCYSTPTRGVSTSTETLPYIAPVPALPIGHACARIHAD